MSEFWSSWIVVLILINYLTILFLFLWAPKVKIPTEPDGTTGHSWAHGTIREGLNPLPKWWLVLSTAGFLAAFVYLVRYPGFGDWKGTLGWTSTDQLHQEIAANNSKQEYLLDQIKSLSVLELAKDADAMRVGKRLFDDNCAACHGYDAMGNVHVGAPALVDNTWLYGGKTADVLHSITDGRNGMMPGWQTVIGEDGVKQVAQYVLSLSGQPHDAGVASQGQAVFMKTCVACHGSDAKGNPLLGAPNLTDNHWLYGHGLDAVTLTIAKGRNGHMPAWKNRLNDDQIKLVAAWVLSHDNTEAALAAGEK